ncbi:protein disulfide isomerase pTAC5, chloroplastic [Arachis duranensis]|uniref:Protein disulfide isomerase pTAC5, chloroplastic n=1 Tax=Arachis duranensis TaxID=130453 RepID=A0A6P4BPK6_ARADU|nr:protein disulfide isomerase pTAC5, chloroplastic [Arachis duranensis]
MSSSASLPLPPLSLTTKSHSPLFSPKSPTLLLLLPSNNFSSLTCRCSTSSPSSSDREEQRWLREEKRWIREEQRWLREEQRWARERDALLREIAELRMQVQALERRLLAQEVSSSEAVPNVAALLQALKDKNLVLESGSNSQQQRLVLVEKKKEELDAEKEEEEVLEHEKEVVLIEDAAAKVEKRITLRMGSEGEQVREMQEALLKLGFYSGEEDMEFSSFSSGTERAVKTWQAALGASEDGVMTSELLERLYLEIQTKDSGNANENRKSTSVSSHEGENGAVVASVTEISEVQQKVVKKGDTEIEATCRGVFLLGENRWEEPSRLTSSDGLDKSKKKDGTTKCLQCRGEGRLLCTECDGSGEPNVEPQFLEWVDEDAKCPYCEGLGYTICDICGGKARV